MRKIILDTDIGPDCDDCGALAILGEYHRRGEIELLAVTHCTSDLYGVDVIAAINEWRGIDVPIGQTSQEGFLADLTKYTLPVSENYLKKHEKPVYYEAISLLRKTLAENDGVTLVFIGPLNNMLGLINSEGDDISPLNGCELIAKSVEQVIVMGGNFKDFSHGEYNIYCDIPAAQVMAEKCPVPIIYCGFEAGENVKTGASLADCTEDYPVRIAYEKYLDGGYIRSSWDLVTVYYAVNSSDPMWVLSDECEIRFNDDATAVVKEGSGAKYVRFADERELEARLNKLIVGQQG